MFGHDSIFVASRLPIDPLEIWIWQKNLIVRISVQAECFSGIFFIALFADAKI